MKTLVVGVVVVAALAAAVWASAPIFFSQTESPSRLLVSGNVEAHQSVVSFKGVQSRVVELPFDEGQWVKAGTLPSPLDDGDYRQQVAISETALRVQQQQLPSATPKLEAARATIAHDHADRAPKNLHQRPT